MIETLVVLGCVLGCVTVVAAPVPPSEAIDPGGARATSTRRAEIRVALTVLVVAAFACLSLMAISYGRPHAVVFLVGALAVAILALHPWLLVRHVFIPLGWVRWAYAASRLGGHPWVRDPEGGACLAAAVAALHRRRPDPEATAFVRDQLHCIRLAGAGLVALGLLAADDSHPDRARRILESIDALDPDACPPHARALARNWLVADAARRGDWSRVLELTGTDPHPDATSHLLRLAAARRVRLHQAEHESDRRVPTRALVWAWLRAPRPSTMFALLRRSWSTPSSDSAFSPWTDEIPADTTMPFVDTGDHLAANDGVLPHHRAVATHFDAAIESGTPNVRRLQHVAASWDATLWDLSFRGHLRQRIRSLGGRRSPEGTALTLRRSVVDDLATWCDALPTSDAFPGGRGDVLEMTRTELSNRAVTGLRAAVARLQRSQHRPAAEVWETWIEIREHWDRLRRIAAPTQLRLAYAELDHPVAAVAIHLHSTRGQRSLAHGLSLWLVQEAERVHDDWAAAQHRRHAVLGP